MINFDNIIGIILGKLIAWLLIIFSLRFFGYEINFELYRIDKIKKEVIKK